MATVPKSFAADFDLWASDLIDRGVDTPEGIAEIRAAIREAFETNPEAAAYWQQRIASEAALIRPLVPCAALSRA